jgi:hypothetical protein
MNRLTLPSVLGVALASASFASHAVTLVALTDSNHLLTLDSAAPANISNVAITGTAAGESIISIDFRNPDRQIYGLSTLGNVFKLDSGTGAATTFALGVVPVVTPGVSYEIDFNTQNNNLRVIGNGAAANTNRALNIGTGATAVQTSLSRAGGAVDVVGAAYNQNFIGSPAASLNLYYLDAASDALYVNTNAFAGGALTLVGNLTLGGNPFGIDSSAGFDIASNGQAFISWQENLYGINLGSGALSVLGQIGTGDGRVIGLTSPIPEPETYALMLAGLGLVGFMAKRRRAVSF